MRFASQRGRLILAAIVAFAVVALALALIASAVTPWQLAPELAWVALGVFAVAGLIIAVAGLRSRA